MEKEYTVKEVLEITAKSLMGISVPVALEDQITVPIKKCASNIQIAIEMLKSKEEEADEIGNVFGEVNENGTETDPE